MSIEQTLASAACRVVSETSRFGRIQVTLLPSGCRWRSMPTRTELRRFAYHSRRGCRYAPFRSRIEVSEYMDTVAETRTMSGDRESKAKAPVKGKGGASARADDQRAGKFGRKESHERYALTMQSAGAALFECSSLSPRECGILELIGQGYSNKRVARTLGISAETVKSHVKRVFIKLDVNTRAYAVARAQSLGIFGLELVRPRSVIAARESRDAVSA